MASIYAVDNWQTYRIDYAHPHRVVEPEADEMRAVDGGLQALATASILPHARYDADRFLAHRRAVAERFEIPWTAITPRMQRLLYAINAIAEPKVLVAVGIFCGNTFISNAGAGVGPGACYTPERLVGIEIVPAEAERARRNVATVDPEGHAEILAEDGVAWLAHYAGTIDLLYLDANGPNEGKSIYFRLLEAAQHALRPGSLVLAHNSVNAAGDLADYLAYVRDPAHFRNSMNMFIDGEGLEVSLR